MNNKVIVSVVMPVYNESRYIDKCVQSLLKQDYPLSLMEWIFVDGNSTDDTVKKLETLSLVEVGYVGMPIAHAFAKKGPRLLKALNEISI